MTPELAMIVAIMALAGFIRGAFGFGDALFAMPLLAFVLPVTAAAPLMALVALLIAVIILFREWRSLEFRSAATLIAAGLVGIPIGVFALRVIDERVVKALLGLTVIVFSTWSIVKPDFFRLASDRWAPLFGICAGILGGAYNTSGPPLVIFAMLRQWPIDRFRATMQVYCLFSSTGILVMHALAGNVKSETFHQFAWAIPVVILLTVAGQKLTGHLAKERFVRLIHGFLILPGVALIASSLTSFAAAG